MCRQPPDLYLLAQIFPLCSRYILSHSRLLSILVISTWCLIAPVYHVNLGLPPPWSFQTWKTAVSSVKLLKSDSRHPWFFSSLLLHIEFINKSVWNCLQDIVISPFSYPLPPPLQKEFPRREHMLCKSRDLRGLDCPRKLQMYPGDGGRVGPCVFKKMRRWRGGRWWVSEQRQ